MKVHSYLKDVMGSNRATKHRKKNIRKSSKELKLEDPISATAKRLHPGKILVTVKEVREVAKNTKAIVLESPMLPYFRAGQFLTLEVNIGTSIVTRPYSIASAPYQTRGEHPLVEIIVREKKEDAFVSAYLCHEVKAGDQLIAEVGLGGFHYEKLRDSTHLVALAGGNGITPFLSMAKEIKNGKLDVDLTILYGFVSQEDIPSEELKGILCDKVKVIPVCSGNDTSWMGEKGYLSKELIQKYSPQECTYFICGPRPMYQFIKEQLDQLAVPAKRIRFESSGSAIDITQCAGYPQELKEKTFTLTVVQGLKEIEIPALAKESIGTALERAGLKIHMGCRGGGCGMCRVKVLAGTYFVNPTGDGRRATDKEYHYVHSCATYPTSDMKIKVDLSNRPVENSEAITGFYKEKYDAIVIGSALAGMAAALELHDRGIKDILVVEQHNLPGGVSTSFVRGGVEIEASLHEMCSISSEKYPLQVRKYLEAHGIHVDWCRVDEAFCYTEPGFSVKVHAGEGGNFERPCHDIADAVKDPDGSIYKELLAFFDDCKKIYFSLGALINGMPSVPTILKHHIEMARAAGYSTQEVLDSYQFPDIVKRILGAYWVYLGNVPTDLPFMLYAFILCDYLGYGPYIPQHTCHELSLKTMEACAARGIQMEYSQRVDKILTKDGHVYGVRLASGIEIKSPYVISGAYPQTVFTKLFDHPEHLPVKAKKLLNSKKMSSSCFSLIMILDQSIEELGLTDYATFYAPDGMDYEKILASYHGHGRYNYLTSISMNVVIPDVTPKGSCLYSITAVPYPDGWKDVTEENYEEWKNTIAAYMLEDESRRLGFDLKSHIKEIVFETPVSISHYVGAYQGGIYGFLSCKEDSVVARNTMHGKEVYYPGLSFAGAHQTAGDGMGPAFNNGIRGADDALEQMKKEKVIMKIIELKEKFLS